MKRRATAAALAAALALAAAGCGGGARPNVILITLESLRADHLGGYGYERETSPNLDRFADEAIRYTGVHAVTPWTLPSHATILTGLYPTTHRVREPHDRLDDSYITVGEILAERGWHTEAVVAGPFLRAPYNLNQGFTVWDDSPSAVEQETAHGDVTNPVVEEKILRFLRSAPREPFFYFAYLWDIHYDFLPPPPFDTLFTTPEMEPFDDSDFDRNPLIHPGMEKARLDWTVARYDGEIRCTDEMLGRIFAVLREEGLWENTVIVITSDHGEEFFEHGAKGHKNNLHVESVHVPLWIKPAGAPAPRVDDRTGSLADVAPTLLDLCGIRPPEEMQGRSLLGPPPEGTPERFQELRITYYGHVIGRGYNWKTKTFDSWALQEGNLKYILMPMKLGERLYRIDEDPWESRNLAEEMPGETTKLRARADEWRARLEEAAARYETSESASLSPEERERLEALGYLQ